MVELFAELLGRLAVVVLLQMSDIRALLVTYIKRTGKKYIG